MIRDSQSPLMGGTQGWFWPQTTPVLACVTQYEPTNLSIWDDQAANCLTLVRKGTAMRVLTLSLESVRLSKINAFKRASKNAL